MAIISRGAAKKRKEILAGAVWRGYSREGPGGVAHTPTTPSIAIKTTTRQAGRKESKEGNMRVECVCDWEARVKSWSSSSSDVFRRPPGDCFVVLLRFFVVVCVCVSDSRRFVVHRPSEHVMYTRFPLCESRSLYIKHASQSAVYGRTCCVVSLWLGEIHRNSWSIFIVVVVDVVVLFFCDTISTSGKLAVRRRR